MRIQIRLLFVLVAMSLLAVPAAAQDAPPADSCGDDESPIVCFQRLWDASDAKKTMEAERAVEEERGRKEEPGAVGRSVQASATPVNLETLAASSLTDFLSWFAGGVGIGSFDDKDDSWTFRFNPWSPYTPSSKSDFLVAITADEPELFPPLGQALADGDLVSTKEKLSDDLGELDDVTLGVSWNRRSEGFGRDFRSHRQLISGLYNSMVQRAYAQVEATAFAELLAALNSLPRPQGMEADLSAMKFGEIESTLDDAAAEGAEAQPDGADGASFVATIKNLVVEAANQELSADRALDAEIEASGFRRLADLINNQPQIQATASYRSRDEAVGPDEVAGQLTAEIGLINLRTFKSFCAGRDSKQVDVGCLRAYTEEMGDAIAAAPRITLSLEYADIDDFVFSLPDDDFEFRQDGGERVIGSLSYGVYLRPDAPLESRFELDASYQDVDGDSMRQDRFVATATFIQKLSDGTATSLSLVYANKPEYLGEVDEELSARVGLRYSMGGKKKD